MEFYTPPIIGEFSPLHNFLKEYGMHADLISISFLRESLKWRKFKSHVYDWQIKNKVEPKNDFFKLTNIEPKLFGESLIEKALKVGFELDYDLMIKCFNAKTQKGILDKFFIDDINQLSQIACSKIIETKMLAILINEIDESLQLSILQNAKFMYHLSSIPINFLQKGVAWYLPELNPDDFFKDYLNGNCNALKDKEIIDKYTNLPLLLIDKTQVYLEKANVSIVEKKAIKELLDIIIKDAENMSERFIYSSPEELIEEEKKIIEQQIIDVPNETQSYVAKEEKNKDDIAYGRL